MKSSHGKINAEIAKRITEKKAEKEIIQSQLDLQNKVWLETYNLFRLENPEGNITAEQIEDFGSAFSSYLESNGLFKQIKQINIELVKLSTQLECDTHSADEKSSLKL